MPWRSRTADARGLTNKDGVKQNNRIENLEYVSMDANRQHATSLGLWGFGERNGIAMITEDDVRTIRSLHGTMPLYRIGEKFGITRQNVRDIVTRVTWKHVWNFAGEGETVFTEIVWKDITPKSE